MARTDKVNKVCDFAQTCLNMSRFDANLTMLGGWIYLDMENSRGAQPLYLHVHRFEALLSIICRGISRGQG